MVFKAYLRLIPSYMGVAVMYMAMFAVLLGMTMMGRSGLNGSAESIDGFVTLLAVNDKDNTEESRAFLDYLENSPNIKMTDIDFEKENAVQDSLYYRKAEYVLTINKGFAEALGTGETENLLSSQVIAGSASEVFTESCIDAYISAARLYITGGYDTAEACREAARTLENGVEVTSFSGNNGWDNKNTGAYLFYNFIPYIMLMMILGILVPTFSSFLCEDVKARSFCAPVSPARYMMQIICGAFMVCLVSCVVLLAAGTVITGGTLFNEHSFYSLLQMLVFMLFSLALSAFVGILSSESVKKANYITSMVSNVLGLGMAFLCGIFVSQSLLGENILMAAKFLPAYWYVKANNSIFGADGAVFDEEIIWSAIGIQALFALALLAGALLAAQIKRGKENK